MTKQRITKDIRGTPKAMMTAGKFISSLSPLFINKVLRRPPFSSIIAIITFHAF